MNLIKNLDNLKKRYISNNTYNYHNEQTTSMSQILSSTIKSKGFLGMYEGLLAKVLHASLTYAILFSCKEKFSYYTFVFMLYFINKQKLKVQ